MKVLIAIALSFFCLIYSANGQVSNGYIDSFRLQEIIRLYLSEQYNKMDALLKNYGYSKSEDDPFKVLEGFSSPGSFLYTYDLACFSGQYDRSFWIKYRCQNEPRNCDYYIRNIIYSPNLQEYEDAKRMDYLKKYVYNLVEAITTGNGDPYTWVNTNTPESVKRNGDLYLFKAQFFATDAQAQNKHSSFCGLNYRIGYEMHFRRGYFSLDSVGYVATNEGSSLRLRDGPSLNSNIITTIPAKSEVFIVEYSDKIDFVNGQSGNWYKIKYEGTTGWAWGNFIKREKEK